MKLPHRRQFLHLAAGAAALPAASRIASAQAYPSRPVRWIVGFAAGGVVDIYARLLGQWLSERLGQPIIIENRVGAGGNIGTEALVKAAPDGYTLGSVTVSNAINATLYDKLSFNIVRDITPIASFNRGPGVIVVKPSFPAKTIPELIAYAKANRGKVHMASPGIGSSHHVYGELFKVMTGVDMLHVAYRGYPQALSDLLAGPMDVMFDNIPTTIEHIRAGNLRALAVTGAMRWEALPDIPTVNDFVPGYEAIGWQGLCGPRNMHMDIVDKLNMEINAGLANPNIRARIAEMGGMPRPMTAGEFGKVIAGDTEKWGKVIRAANIKAE
jgi:tripartite-type tricarboxylate transporter receptor subunit TctC